MCWNVNFVCVGQEQDEKKKIGLMKPLHETNYYILIYMIDFDWIKLFM
jgi:hypothetical protein